MIGVMQGRLLPPVDGKLQEFPFGRWADEFDIAKGLGLENIEWIYSARCPDDNPLSSRKGLGEIDTAQEGSPVVVRSLCADYFVDYPILRRWGDILFDIRIRHFNWLLAQCEHIGINRVVLPYVDTSAIETDDDYYSAIEACRRIGERADALGVTVCLETNLSPANQEAMMREVDCLHVGLCFDSGNTANLGWSADEMFSLCGDYIRHVHVKDRKLVGKSVPLGQGNADFVALSKFLKSKFGYPEDIVTLQVARGESGKEAEWVRKQLDYVLALR